ncbi:hypothetical protein TrRE_jg2680, partial [Triparma retinervis]
RRSSKNKVDKD